MSLSILSASTFQFYFNLITNNIVFDLFYIFHFLTKKKYKLKQKYIIHIKNIGTIFSFVKSISLKAFWQLRK